MSSPKPGIILVRSRISSLSLTPETFRKWYEDVHIPDVLATNKVKAALRYHTIHHPRQADDEDDLPPYLAVYHLDDMNWLHEDDCAFWKLPLVVHLPPDGVVSIFDVAEFDMTFYTTVSCIDTGSKDPNAADYSVAPDFLRLIQSHSDQGEVGGAEALLKCRYTNAGASGAVRSTLLHVDESRPHPPHFPPKTASTGEKKYLCIVSFFEP